MPEIPNTPSDERGMRLFGLIGYPLSHSFSKEYFTEKFEQEEMTECRYDLFPLKTIDELLLLLRNKPQLEGLNVTIPFKKIVLSFLDTSISHTVLMPATVSISQRGSWWVIIQILQGLR